MRFRFRWKSACRGVSIHLKCRSQRSMSPTRIGAWVVVVVVVIRYSIADRRLMFCEVTLARIEMLCVPFQ